MVDAETVKVKVMLESIEVLDDHSLKLNFVWSTVAGAIYLKVYKSSDKKNKKMYLRDEQGFKYDHFRGEGAAYKKAWITYPQKGSFYFPPIMVSDSKTITFYDDDSGKSIGPIEVRYEETE